MPLKRPGSLAEARKRHGANSHWGNFARRILRHPHIRQQVWQQQGCCAHCGKPLKLARISIHHLSYEHFCITEKYGPVRGQRGQCPPCHNCDCVPDCLKHLQALCRLCHRRLHRPKAGE